MSKLSFIMIHSKCDGMLYINNQYTGNLQNDIPISMPWDEDTKLNIIFYPFGDEYMILCHSLHILDGAIQPCGESIITLWSEVIELELYPRRNYSPIPLMPIEIDQNIYSLHSMQYSSTIVDYCGTWWIIENGSNPLLCHHLSDERITGKLTRAIMEPITLIFNDDNYCAVTSYNNNHFELIYNGRGKASSQNSIITIADVNDTQGLSLVISYDGQMIKKEYSCANNVALDFLANVQSGKTELAHQKLSSQLQNVFSTNDIMNFIGSFDELAPCRFSSYDGVSFAVKEQLSHNIYSAKSYGFELENGIISNIIELG